MPGIQFGWKKNTIDPHCPSLAAMPNPQNKRSGQDEFILTAPIQLSLLRLGVSS
jgi:hypothetical protein